jgi:hypothetical protein
MISQSENGEVIGEVIGEVNGEVNDEYSGQQNRSHKTYFFLSTPFATYYFH